jgi:threonyl-tRNA synthetase
MPVITLPDGSQRHFDHAVSPMDVALDIGPGLAKATIAGRVNGELVDACDLIENDAPSLSSPQKMKTVWRSFVTPARTCWSCD